MRILKENFYDIVKLYVNQIGIMIFSTFLYTAIGFVEEEPLGTNLITAVSVFATLFYFVLIYYVMWEIGAKDKIRIDGGRYTAPRAKGFLMGLFANVPNFLFSGITIILLLVYNAGATGVSDPLGVFDIIMRFHESMYMGFIRGITPSEAVTNGINFSDCMTESVLFFALPLLSAAVMHLAYTLGSKDKKLFGSNKKSDKK